MIAQTKRGLRRELRAARAALAPHDRAARSAAVRMHLEALPQLTAASSIAAYAAAGTEVDLDPWLRRVLARGATLALPVVLGEAVELAAVEDLGELVRGWRGLREPPPQAARIRADAVDAAVVPGLGFDPHGGRLGQGGGHIDRLLAGLRSGVPVIGVAFGVQIVAAVPVEPHDVAVDLVVTEDGVLQGPPQRELPT